MGLDQRLRDRWQDRADKLNRQARNDEKAADSAMRHGDCELAEELREAADEKREEAAKIMRLIAKTIAVGEVVA